MAVNIVTGYTGVAHVTSDDDRAKNSSIFGAKKFILDYGNSFSAEKLNNNQIRIKDGMLINQGTQMGIEPNDYEDVTIENGVSGMTRIDLICMRYSKNADSAKESASLVVIKGTAVSQGEPTVPEHTQGNILDGGDLIDDMPLYKVRIESLSITDISSIPYTAPLDIYTIYDVTKSLTDELAKKIAQYVAGSVAGVKGTNNEEYKTGLVTLSLDDIKRNASETLDGLMTTTQFKNLKNLISTSKSAIGKDFPINYCRVVNLTSPINGSGNDLYALGIGLNNEVYTYFGNKGSVTANWVKLQNSDFKSISSSFSSQSPSISLSAIGLDSLSELIFVLTYNSSGDTQENISVTVPASMLANNPSYVTTNLTMGDATKGLFAKIKITSNVVTLEDFPLYNGTSLYTMPNGNQRVLSIYYR